MFRKATGIDDRGAANWKRLSARHLRGIPLASSEHNSKQHQTDTCQFVLLSTQQDVQHTVYSKRNTHLIPISFLAPLGEWDQNFTWSIM